MNRKIKIAIDGPAGSGKSTVASMVAERLGLPHIDTGAIYRALTLAAIRRKVSADDESGLSKVADQSAISLEGSKVLLDGEDVTREVRGEGVNAAVSQASVHPEVRRRMVEVQRRLIGDLAVVEGRDIGTVVLPDAELKIYLIASPEERARRRRLDLAEEGMSFSKEQVKKDLELRDRRDSERSTSPLRAAADAIVIDSTGKSAEEVVDEICRLAEAIK